MTPDERTPFGKRLFEAREKAGLTQEVAAKRAGMSQGTLAEAEISGKRSGYTPQLAAIYSVDPVWLATGKGKAKSAGSVTVMEQTKTVETSPAPDDGYFSEPSARILAMQAGLLAVIRSLSHNPNLPVLLDAELARAKDILAANPVDDPVLAAFDDQAELIRLTADIHHGKRS